MGWLPRFTSRLIHDFTMRKNPINPHFVYYLTNVFHDDKQKKPSQLVILICSIVFWFSTMIFYIFAILNPWLTRKNRPIPRGWLSCEICEVSKTPQRRSPWPGRLVPSLGRHGHVPRPFFWGNWLLNQKNHESPSRDRAFTNQFHVFFLGGAVKKKEQELLGITWFFQVEITRKYKSYWDPVSRHTGTYG
jgi:hypothetical protein